MSSLKRVSTYHSVDFDPQDGDSLAPVVPANSHSTSSATKSPSIARRISSTHSLLATNNGLNTQKAAQAEANVSTTAKANISMPPPLRKPSNDRRLSASLASATHRPPPRPDHATAPVAENPMSSPPASAKSTDDRLHLRTSPQLSTTATSATNITTRSANDMSGQVLSPPLDSATVSDMSSLLTSPPVDPTPTEEGTRPTPLARGESTAAVGSVLFPDVPKNAKIDELRNGSALSARSPRASVPRSNSTRRLSRTTSNNNSIDEARSLIGKIGVCALDVKARSRPSRQILTRLQDNDEFEVIIFGDKVINDEGKHCSNFCHAVILLTLSLQRSRIGLYDKAVKYAKLRKPFLVNDLQMQKILWDRRLCLMILDKLRVPTPWRVEVVRDGGPKLESADLARHFKQISGVSLSGEDGTGGDLPSTKSVELIEDGDALLIDGQIIRKPFVEKPVSGEDHNIVIYFPRKQDGGGARKLFRKIGNKSSEYVKDLIVPRCITETDTSYIYEQFLIVENAEDVKAYTVGPSYCHAETRKSPVVDGVVRRNTHGKELRYVTKLTDAEQQMAARIAKGFGQRICGFDLLRTRSESYVIDVNGWSFVKDNEDYYNDCARILKSMFSEWKFNKAGTVTEEVSPAETPEDRHGKKEHAHRSALKTILKSPSMNRLSQLGHPRHHPEPVNGAGSQKSEVVAQTSPPLLDRGHFQSLPPPAKSISQDLPAPILSPETSKSESAVDVQDKEDEQSVPLPSSRHSWKLKGVVAVIRHADRTPKQKIKFTAHSPVFVDLLKGHHEEVLLKGETALLSVQAAVRTAIEQKSEDMEKLRNLSNALSRKIGQPDTKVQIKPMFKKRKHEKNDNDPQLHKTTNEETIPEHAAVQSSTTLSEPTKAENPDSNNQPDAVQRVPTRHDSISDNMFSRYAAKEEDLMIDKMQLVMKWGGEPTHSARYQSQDLGAYMRDDWKLLNRDVLNDVRLFTSSEKRVKTSAQIWAAAFLGQQDVPDEAIQVRKDLLDDSNAAKDVMDKVKKKLKHLLRENTSPPEDFAWPEDVPEPYLVMQNVVELLKFHRRVMRHNFKKLQGSAAASLAASLSSSLDSEKTSTPEQVDISSIQARWCTGEDAELFKERWEKLFKEFCDHEKADPSKISELYDTMKYDALHNKPFLEWVFTPSQSIIDEINREEGVVSQNISPDNEHVEDASNQHTNHRESSASSTNLHEKHSLSQKMGFRKKSVLSKPPSTPPLMSYEQDATYFKLFTGTGETKMKQDKRLGRLRELYRYAKVLFDYIGPQEYGISNDEKLEIGLLTSLPLLREIVQDLEELQASSNSASFIYFTKESHVYTLLNCIMEGGIHTKIKRATIPELDYLSQICFELYEAKDAETEETAYSIRISISPGCHTIDPLDVSLDSKHAIGTAPRRSLTNHQDWRDVISTLKAKFDTVQLPKSFLAVNVSEKHEQEARRASEIAEKERKEALQETLEAERVEEWKKGVAESSAVIVATPDEIEQRLGDGKIVEGEIRNLGTG
ncbi:inositol hexakisphosphate and diphosphoinositol-pentakisphosphate kinase [Lithohypha guttulata]|uniref:Inositol hexakisphosphate and diphosphoinositol-pentakisphosphate kinase n=1 Tax=Lithohypha guttulata TaxID=1690604 RepID=A0AAN7SV57_9EURO|nr:inositol hexakisphosphate and diphosphoinositol-pentakisphosphate kinase [Lithohypha guttulata]